MTQPCAIYKNDFKPVDSFETHLPQLEQIEGTSVELFKKACETAEQDFAEKPDDNDIEKNNKDTMKRLFSSDRFQMTAHYVQKDLDKLTDPDHLSEFVDSILAQKIKPQFQSQTEKRQKHSAKLVGLDFEKRVIESEQDALVLIYHPSSEKNRGLKEKFERFAQQQKANDSQLLIGRMNALNESPVFKNPAKLP